MSRRSGSTIARIGAASLLGVVLATVLAVSPAAADEPSTIEFDSASESVEFGSNWVVTLTIDGPDYITVDTPSGTVEVLVEGIAGAFATDVPIYRGGVVYLSQPTDVALLGAGEHRLTAIFHPAAGSGLVSSQTPTPFVLTVAPLALTATATVVDDSLDPGAPYLELDTSGAFVEALGSPAGQWTIAVTDGSNQVLARTVDQSAGATEPERVSLADVIRPGRTYAIETTFEPESEAASGATLTGPEPISYTVPAASPIEFLTTAVALPWWLLALLVLAVLGSIAWLIVVIVRGRPRAIPAAPSAEPDSERLPEE